MKKRPNICIINGERWKINWGLSGGGAEFSWKKHLIRIGKDSKNDKDRWLPILLHEVFEIIMCNYWLRFTRSGGADGNRDYLFCLNHDQFEIFAHEVALVVNQLT